MLKGTAALAFGLFFFSILWTLTYKFMNPIGTTLMVQRDWQGVEVIRHWTPIEDMSPHIIRAVIAAEDSKFCQHHGFDIDQIKVALKEAENGERLRGASTISQQTAKNAFLWQGRGVIRKGSEAWFTVLLETFWSKQRTMEIYLNIAEWGDGYFGIEAAAQGRFGKSARDLTQREAALLAAVLPSPNKWRANPPGPYVSRRAHTLQKRMRVVQNEGFDSCVLPLR